MESKEKFDIYNKAQEQLFRDWYQKQKVENPDYLGTEFPNENFSKDGIISPKYFDQEIRVLYLMVEENLTHEKKGPPYICDYNDLAAGQKAHAQRVIQKECNPGTFYNNLSRMQTLLTSGIHREVPADLQRLLGAAIVNINKRGGYASRNISGPMAEKYARVYSDFILKQIQLIAPNVIICGQTYSILRELLTVSKAADICYNNSGYFIWDGRIVFDFYHPSARFRVDTYTREKHNNKIWIGDIMNIINKNMRGKSGK